MLSRRKFLLSNASLAAMVWAAPSRAFWHGSSATFLTSKIQIGTSANEVCAYKNLLSGGNSLFTGTSGFAFPAFLNADQYPTGTIPNSISLQVALPSNLTSSDTLVFAWTGSASTLGSSAMQLTRGSPGFTVTAGAGFVTGSTSLNLVVSGTNGYVEFSCNGTPAGITLALAFNGGQTFSLSDMILCRKSDYASIIGASSAADLIRDDYVAAFKALNPKTIRTEGWGDPNDQSNFTQHRYRNAWQTALCYGRSWIPTCWAGGPGTAGPNITSPTTFGQYVCAGGTDTPAAYTMGEVIQGQLTTNVYDVTGAANNGSGNVRLTLSSIAGISNGMSLTTQSIGGTTEANGVNTVSNVGAGGNTVDLPVAFVHPYTSGGIIFPTAPGVINVAGRGSVPIYNDQAGLGIDARSAANFLWTFIYDDLLGGFMAFAGGYAARVPIEVQIGLANRVGCNLWYQFPPHVTTVDSTMEPTNSVKQITALASSTLTNGCYFEWANEVWNFTSGFEQTQWSVACGAALGFPTGNNRQYHGFYGYRVATVMPQVVTAWGAKPGLKCLSAFQAFGTAGLTGDINKYRLQGADLASVANGGQGNALWISYTGNANFTAFPNRPVDFCDTLSYASYYSGAQLANFDPNYSNAGGTGLTTGGPAGWSTGLLGAADAYAAGGSTNIANALAFVDWDIRQGTNNGTAGGQTLLALASGHNGVGIYPAWETVAASYDGARPSGKLNLTVECYEGAMECSALSTGRCTVLGISTSYGGVGGKIDNLLTAYKNSSLFFQLVQDQLTQFLAQPHSVTGSWLILTGGNQWSLYPGDINTTPWQSYPALAAF